MEKVNKKNSIFLAGNLFLVTLLAVPTFKLNRKTEQIKIEISSDDSVRIQGFTKNEVTSAHQIADQSQKDSKVLKSLVGIIFVKVLYLAYNKPTNLNLLFFTGAIQLSFKALIFPFHTFW